MVTTISWTMAVSLITMIGCLWTTGCAGNELPAPNRVPLINQAENPERIDVLRLIYSIAEEKGMRVIADLNMHGGELFKQHTTQQVAQSYRSFVSQFHKRYGGYRSFWGWYINNELNPLKPDEVEVSSFWRTVWRSAVEECKRIAPESKVTISPFFILDKDEHRGFEYVKPIEYEQWWSKTLAETGIDILMLQDSGAEHLGFFTLADRKPFFQAFKNACDQAGSELWLNVETGEVDAKDWKEAIDMERKDNQRWVYTETSWLVEKVKLASKYADNIISWGYYPFMTPTIAPGPYLTNDIPVAQRKASYDSYREYYDGTTDRSLIRGTLWWLPAMYDGWSKEAVEHAIREQIEDQESLGFDVLWIVNAPGNMDWALAAEK